MARGGSIGNNPLAATYVLVSGGSSGGGGIVGLGLPYEISDLVFLSLRVHCLLVEHRP